MNIVYYPLYGTVLEQYQGNGEDCICQAEVVIVVPPG
jgi:hypothetical protein